MEIVVKGRGTDVADRFRSHVEDKLAKVTVTAEVLGEERGPKIVIQKFKNKTGYIRRQGHRSELSTVKVTEIA